jgi:hypothetical protein
LCASVTGYILVFLDMCQCYWLYTSVPGYVPVLLVIY